MHKRVDIKTGFMCNNNCLFCVQGSNKFKGNRQKEDIFKDLKEAKKTGCKGVVFTGGEVSIRDDFFELLSYAKQQGFEVIQVQTNGRRFFYKDFCRRAIDAGMNEFAPAVHGHIPELHDYLTRSKGAFSQVTEAIRNVKREGIYVVSNTVVVKPNYMFLPEIAELLVSLKVDQFQFAFMHAMGNAEKNFDQMMPSVSLAAPYIKRGLQIGIDNDLKVMAEAMPFCVMEGYEKYVSELYIPDTEIRTESSYDPDFSSTRKESGKVKFSFCKNCRYDIICEGPWKEYPKKMGSEEFRPVPGKKVLNKNELI
jgi:MoaA/NifB/PqqE/SkfB family radical SAM enzyme